MIKLKQNQKNIVIGLVLLLGILGFVFWTQSDNTGKITPQKDNFQAAAVPGIKQFDGLYMTFEYSGQYVVRQIQNRGDDLELYEFDANKPYPKKVAVSISNLPDGTLNSNSAYLLRKSHTDKFYERPLPQENLKAEVWSSTDGTKQTVFVVRNGRVAVLAFTQDGGDKSLYNNEVDTIVGSFKWK